MRKWMWSKMVDWKLEVEAKKPEPGLPPMFRHSAHKARRPIPPTALVRAYQVCPSRRRKRRCPQAVEEQKGAKGNAAASPASLARFGGERERGRKLKLARRKKEEEEAERWRSRDRQTDNRVRVRRRRRHS